MGKVEARLRIRSRLTVTSVDIKPLLFYFLTERWSNAIRSTCKNNVWFLLWIGHIARYFNAHLCIFSRFSQNSKKKKIYYNVEKKYSYKLLERVGECHPVIEFSIIPRRSSSQFLITPSKSLSFPAAWETNKAGVPITGMRERVIIISV